tara:strand:- start:87 stop:269 length:183 start_codon:yes stop_codon:yes gene_type:complete
MNKVHVDVCLDMVNHPFIELIEDDKIPNLWHHKKIKNKFYLTANGFKQLSLNEMAENLEN